jgi:hypothetical protein
MMAMKLDPERGEIHEPIGVGSRFADPSLHSSRVSQSARRSYPEFWITAFIPTFWLCRLGVSWRSFSLR